MARTRSLGIDIGGTFTDIVAYDQETGRVWKGKELTTPDDPSRGVLSAIQNLFSDKDEIASLYRIVHATTLFTNALIERKGAKVGLITTAGFRDVLEIGNERKFELYDVFINMPRPLVPRELRAEAPERVGPDGEILQGLNETALLEQVEHLRTMGIDALAVSFLHAYANPAHEIAALAAIEKAYPDLIVTASHDVAPEIREYERTSTTVTNAYVKPLAHTYLDEIREKTSAMGADAPFFMMLSNGGLTHIEEAKRNPVQLLESGPAAGALAAAYFGELSGEDNLLAFDMGGTTAKLALVEGGEPRVTYHFEAAREKRFIEGSGLPLNISAVELIEIGAGGGSIAHVDAMGLLKVGPQSSGAMPGPACYGRGGAQPTVTDADLLLGYLNPDYFAGGSFDIDVDAARAAMDSLAQQSGLSVTDAAFGIHDVVNENMAGAARVHIAEQGRDPRDYTLLATGGAGPVHAFAVAKKLGLRKLLCPASAGVASAVGLLVAPARVERVATVSMPLDSADWTALEAAYTALEQDAAHVITETGFDAGKAQIIRLADMRYIGQGFEVVVTLPGGPYTPDHRAALQSAFEGKYRESFSRIPPDGRVEIINIRVSMRAAVDGGKPQLTAEATDLSADTKTRPVYFRELGDFIETAVYARGALSTGTSYQGPAIVEEAESTLVVGPGGTFTVDAAGNLIVTLEAAA